MMCNNFVSNGKSAKQKIEKRHGEEEQEAAAGEAHGCSSRVGQKLIAGERSRGNTIRGNRPERF